MPRWSPFAHHDGALITSKRDCNDPHGVYPDDMKLNPNHHPRREMLPAPRCKEGPCEPTTMAPPLPYLPMPPPPFGGGGGGWGGGNDR